MNAKAQVEGLMSELLSFARKMLSEHGELNPFGGYLKAPSTLVQVGVGPSNDRKTAQQRLYALISGFKKITDTAIAFGIVTDVRLPQENGSNRDAIKIFLEYKSGYCAVFFFRYEMSTDGGVQIWPPTAQQGDLLFFIR
jgi:hypothetical protein